MKKIMKFKKNTVFRIVFELCMLAACVGFRFRETSRYQSDEQVNLNPGSVFSSS